MVAQRDFGEDLRCIPHDGLHHMIEADLRIREEIIPKMVGEFDRCFWLFIFCTQKIANQINDIVDGFFRQAEFTQEDPDE
jgi:hypothetical protein